MSLYIIKSKEKEWHLSNSNLFEKNNSNKTLFSKAFSSNRSIICENYGIIQVKLEIFCYGIGNRCADSTVYKLHKSLF